MGLPLTVYPGTYTPGAETALHAAVDVINETWAQGNTKLAALETKIKAVAGDTGFLATVGSPHVTDASAVAAPTSRSTKPTRHPWPANSCTRSAPIPEAPPVMNTVRPFRLG